MTRDDYHQVTYTCSICSKEKQIDDTSLARIAETFNELGWGNVEVQKGDKTEYFPYCPPCYAQVYKIRFEGDYQAFTDEQDSLDDERPGLW
jgi:hypothetical protein